MRKLLISVVFVGFSCVSSSGRLRGSAVSRSGQPILFHDVENSRMQFEVATVKRSDSQQRVQILNALLTYPGGRVVARGATLDFLLMEAYGLQPFQISGGPIWMNSARFDIQAKPSAEIARHYPTVANVKAPPPDELRYMLQNLLLDRFHITLHLGESPGSVYLMTRGHGKLHLFPSKDKREYPWAGSIEGGSPNGDGLRGTNITMSALAHRVSLWLSMPVVDRTALDGSFDFEFVLDPGEDRVTASDVQSNVIESLKGLGLDIHKSQGMAPHLFVEQAVLPTPD